MCDHVGVICSTVKSPLLKAPKFLLAHMPLCLVFHPEEMHFFGIYV